MLTVLTDGGYAISDEIAIPGTGTSDFAFASGWLLEIVNVESGDYYFLRDGEAVRSITNRFGVFYPSFTFVRAFVSNTRGEVCGIGSERAFPELPTAPFIFETDFQGNFHDVADAFDVLNSCRNPQSIEVNTKPSLISLKTKRLIDENYLIYPSIARIAGRLNVSHEHLSRQFKKDYGLTPSAYLHKLRVAEATYRLSLGQEIIEISQEVGYNDLSRFYKQFRKATQTSPAICRQMFEK
jgi:AraC-like DNA-binding protein